MDNIIEFPTSDERLEAELARDLKAVLRPHHFSPAVEKTFAEVYATCVERYRSDPEFFPPSVTVPEPPVTSAQLEALTAFMDEQRRLKSRLVYDVALQVMLREIDKYKRSR